MSMTKNNRSKMDQRKDDDQGDKVRYFRTGDRFARVGNQYWFSTREGEEGPFASREAAEKALGAYVASQQFQSSRKAVPVIEERVVKGDPTIWDRQIDII